MAELKYAEIIDRVDWLESNWREDRMPNLNNVNFDNYIIGRQQGEPDEPEHQQRCGDCHRFLPRAGWQWEEIEEDRQRYVDWFVRCRGCGWVQLHKTS